VNAALAASLGAIGDGAATVGQHLADIGQEVTEIRFTGPRARTCTASALSVVLAVTLAQWAGFDDVWWAGISGFMASQATRPASVQRSLLRIVGTAIGAALGCVAMSLAAYDHVALCLLLFAFGTVGVLGLSVSAYGYVWLFGGLTANMIIMMAMNDPARTSYIAFDRLAEVSIGSLAAVLMATLLAPETGGPPAPPQTSGWSELLGARWPAVGHAVRSGATIMLLPVIWNLFNLPSLTQMAVTVVAVMAVPVTTDDPRAIGRTVIGRAELRLLGCLGGGALGLLCLALPLTLYPLWLAVLFAGIWVSAYVGASTGSVGYAGIQATIVFLMTLVQGNGPPSSILPGIDRFAGITGGIAVLLVISLVLWPSPPRAERA
jgi:uncharacterized membrane protein YccC